MKMKYSAEVFLFRHGEARNNIDAHLITGRGDNVPLTPLGVEQAERLGRSFRELGILPDVIYSSPALRARSTAELALKSMGIAKDLIIDERLHEQHTGDWTGRLAKEIFTKEQISKIEAKGKKFKSPNGESMDDVGSRMYEWLDDNSNSGTVFGFTHGGAIRCLASELLDWTHAQTYQTQPGNTSVSIFRKKPEGVWEVHEIAIDARELVK